MSKHFSFGRKTNPAKPRKAREAKPWPEGMDFGPAEGATPVLPARLWGWLDARMKGEGAGLMRRGPGIDMLEPRLLMSADPVTASAALASGVSDAALRVYEVTGENNTTELRLQLIRGTNAQSNDASLVISEWRVATVGDTKRVFLLDQSGGDIAVDVLSITGNAGANTLVLDQSILSLADGVKIDISLGDGNDTIIGPEASAGLV